MHAYDEDEEEKMDRKLYKKKINEDEGKVGKDHDIQKP